MKDKTLYSEEKIKLTKKRLRRNHWKQEPMYTKDFLRLPLGLYELIDSSGIYKYYLQKEKTVEAIDDSVIYTIWDQRDSFRNKCIHLHEEKEPIIDWDDNETGYYRTALSATTSVSGFFFITPFYHIYNKLYFIGKKQ